MDETNPKIERINGYTCIQGVMVNISLQGDEYYTRIRHLRANICQYERGVFLKKPREMEVINCKSPNLSDVLSISRNNGSVLDIKVEGFGKKAKQIALGLYNYISGR